MDLGIFIAADSPASQFRDAIKRTTGQYVSIGHRFDSEGKSGKQGERLERRFMTVNFAPLYDGNPAGRLFAPKQLRHFQVSHVVNVGDLVTLLASAFPTSVANPSKPLAGNVIIISDEASSQPMYARRRRASEVLQNALAKARVKTLWLADVSRRHRLRNFHISEGPLTTARLGWGHSEIDAAVARARDNMNNRQVCGVWLDDGEQGKIFFDTRHAIERGAAAFAGRRKPVAIWVAPNEGHCPLDAPFITDNTILKASKSGIAALLIDSQRGVLANRMKACILADDFNLPILGV